jgi:hypothetical protein
MYHDRDFGLYIGGQWSWGSGKQTKPILDPATEGVIGHIPDANAEDIDGALRAAAAGLQAWRKVQPWDRSEKLRKVSELRISASNDTREWNNPTSANQIRLQTSLIRQASLDSASLASRIWFPTRTLQFRTSDVSKAIIGR